MTAALAVSGCTMAVAWAVPVLLGRPTRHGISARPGRHARYGLALAAVTLLLACPPVLVTVIAGHLVPPA